MTDREEGPPVDPWEDPDVEIVSRSEVERWDRDRRTRHIRGALVGWAHFAAAVGAVVSILAASWELAAFVYAMTAYVIGKGVGHVVTDEDRVGRVLFFGLPPLAGVVGLLVAYAVWERWWMAALAGAAAAVAVNLLAKKVFRRVAWEERLESLRG